MEQSQLDEDQNPPNVSCLEGTTSNSIVGPIGSTSSKPTLQNMLKFSTGLTASTKNDLSGGISEESKQFFNNFMKAHMLNEMDIVMDSLKSLDGMTNDAPAGDICQELENIHSVIDRYDNSTDFLKVGGFQRIARFLHSENASVVIETLHVIGTACQNHSVCQNAVVDDFILDEILKLMTAFERGYEVIRKALFALSSTILHNKKCHHEFIHAGGYQMLQSLFKTSDVKLKQRACFLINNLYLLFPESRKPIVDSGTVRSLIEFLVSLKPEDDKEFVVEALHSCVHTEPSILTAAVSESSISSETLLDALYSVANPTDDAAYVPEVCVERATVLINILRAENNDEHDRNSALSINKID